MTPSQHAQRIRQLEFQLHIADYGMGMPRDYPRVLELRVMLNEARRAADEDALEASMHLGVIRNGGIEPS